MLVLILNAQNLFRYNCLKLHFLSFLVPIFQFIPVLNGLNKTIPLIQLWKNAVFRKFLLIWNEFDKNEQIQIFYWLIINSLSRASCWLQQRGLQAGEAPVV